MQIPPLRCFFFVLLLLVSAENKRLYRYYHQHQRNPKHTPEQTISILTHHYVIYHYFQNPTEIQSKLTIPGENTADCESNLAEILCIPNSYLICLSNGTLLCVTDIRDVVTCDFGKPRGVSFKETCEGNSLCDPDQSVIDVCMPCIANVTLVIRKKFYESTSHRVQSMVIRQHLCLTVLAEPRKLEPPFGSTLEFLSEVGKWVVGKMV